MTGLYVKTDFEVQMKIMNISIQILILNVIVLLPDTFLKLPKCIVGRKIKRKFVYFFKLNMT